MAVPSRACYALMTECRGSVSGPSQNQNPDHRLPWGGVTNSAGLFSARRSYPRHQAATRPRSARTREDVVVYLEPLPVRSPCPSSIWSEGGPVTSSVVKFAVDSLLEQRRFEPSVPA